MKSLHRKTKVLLAAAVVVLGGASAQAETLRVGSVEAFNNPARLGVQFGLEHLQETLPETSGGQLDVKLFPGGVLGSETESLKDLKSGVLDAAVVSPGNAASIIPQLQLFSTSYLFSDFDHVLRVLTDETFREELDKIIAAQDVGLRLGGIAVTGARTLYTRTREVATPDDMTGIKMRVMNSPTEFKVWSAFGALPVNVSWTELYSALQSGVVDAAEASITAIMNAKFYEVAPHISLTEHQYNLQFYFVSDKTLSDLDDELAQTLLETVDKSAQVASENSIRLAAESAERLAAVESITITEVDKPQFQTLVSDLQDQVAEDNGMMQVLERIRQLK